MNWSGKVAVVTGAAQGMGAAQARLLLERGAIVYAIDKAEITEWPGTQPGLLVPYRMDVTEPPAWDELAATLAARSEPLVALVNNAGVTFRRSVTETTPAPRSPSSTTATSPAISTCSSRPRSRGR